MGKADPSYYISNALILTPTLVLDRFSRLAECSEGLHSLHTSLRYSRTYRGTSQ
jgi:hypothetical protein